jgi:alginate O-acetyltransferase complex protein AlgI
MLFNSVDFIIFFVVIIIGIVIIKNRKFQHLLLLGGSYFFFYYTSNYLIILLIFSTILDFYVGKYMGNSTSILNKKILLTVSLIGNLGLLGFYKYADFAILQFNILGNYFDLSTDIPLLELALPIGISFYTFQTISYTVDIYRGKLTPSKSLREFALFVSFFPQLVAGPIVRASDFLPQLREKISSTNNKCIRKILITNQNLKLGITIMMLGFFKKVFFADNIAPFVDEIFVNPIGLDSLTIILATIGFGIQIYADFSGYSDIAIGAALILGFKLPVNFNKPYFAISPSDFWKRWHISLSSWLRDYLYIPLGGNKKSNSRTYFNLMTVMILGGLWHGASWNFIVWGLLHGVYLAIHKLISNKFPKIKNHYFFKTKIGKIISIFITQYFIFLSWIAFRVNDVDHMLYAIEKYVFIDIQLNEFMSTISIHKFPILLIFLFIFLHYLSYRKMKQNEITFAEFISKISLKYWILVLTSIITLILLFVSGDPEAFIYFKF